jgi:hypothetical protein
MVSATPHEYWMSPTDFHDLPEGDALPKGRTEAKCGFAGVVQLPFVSVPG